MTALLQDVALWKRVLDDAALLAASGALEPAQWSDVRAVARLRSLAGAPEVQVAIELLRARRKAEGKLADAAFLVADVAGVESATSALVARHKARRFAAAGATEIADLCCGIGGDAIELARIADVLAVDALPVRAFMAASNAGCLSAVEDVETRALPAGYFHLDPSRRSEETSGGQARRNWRLADYRPGPAVIQRLLAGGAVGAVKLGPGIDRRDLETFGPHELEFISEGGTLVQAVMWSGDALAAPGMVTATRLPEGLSVQGESSPTDAVFGEARRYVFEADPALERAQLVGAAFPDVDLVDLHPGLGLFTSDIAIASPWLQRYEVDAVMPWRIEKVRAWLHARDAGVIEVKTRGGAVDAGAAQKELRGDGSASFTVFGLRLGKEKRAVICRRA